MEYSKNWINILLLPVAAVGAIKFNFPICFTQFLMKIKKWNRKETWLEFLRDYAKCCCSTYFLASCSMTMFCVFFKIFGNVPPFYLFTSLPSALGCAFAHYVPHKVRHPQALGITGLFFEFLMRSSKNKLIKTIRRSRFWSMLLSTTMSTTLYYTKIRRFWFAKIDEKHEAQCIADVNFNELVLYEDEKEMKKPERAQCNHSGPCSEIIKKDLTFSVILGLVLGSLRVALPRLPLLVTHPIKFWKIFPSKFDYGIFGFFSSYATLFRIVNCYLSKKSNFSTIFKLALSGFVAGLTFFFYPNFMLFNFALTNAIELVWKSLVKFSNGKKDWKLKKIIEKIDKIPMTTVLYILGVGVMFQLRVIYPYYTSPIIYRLMNIGTGRRTDILAENYAALMMGLK